ncbi:putative ABC transport system ATP-binding protein [Psychroflexus salarius]|uniref:Putative ABC transport system ATP-binding protein n=1 Tax=Psychroflexus salarius TaxID=1155689 RepID=A0A1M4Y2X7_9FLAO|nr:ABC transporter ATP-binding protein [Psychroflexus salarius]SHF00048.1 putative ABC transport system ATP-binding protein [Psychroflexus salarius]
MTKPLISLQHVYKYHYTDKLETSALNNLSLDINQGEFLSIMGPSGSGKSTLLNILGMIDVCSKGQYFFNEQPIHEMNESERTKLRKGNVSFIFQSFNLIDELTAYENIELPLLYLGVKPKSRKERVEAVLNDLEMAHRKDHFPQQLSGGQQQRVAIARAVVTQPKMVLADEPTGNLDSKNSEAVMAILQKLHNEGTTLIMVTHSAHDASYAERQIELFDGQILQHEQQLQNA